jgi:iron complex outermembrane receptor protein
MIVETLSAISLFPGILVRVGEDMRQQLVILASAIALMATQPVCAQVTRVSDLSVNTKASDIQPIAQRHPTTAPNEETTEPEPEEIEILVTAEKFIESVQNIPISITVLTREDLEDAQIESFEDVARNTPNFFFLPSPSRDFVQYSIRGLGNANSSNRDAVGIYIDDVPYDYGGFLDLTLFDLERVEVLRGPQSTLYGRNSQAGVVNIISRQPTNFPEVGTALSYGNYNNLNAQLSLSDAIAPDRLFFRLSGAYNRRDGFVENTFLDEKNGDLAGGAARAQLLWTPSSEWNISLTGAYSGSNNDSAVYIPLNQSNIYRTEVNDRGYGLLDTNTQALKISYNNPSFQLTSITTRRYSDNKTETDADFTSADLVRVVSHYDSTLWSQEIRLQSPQADDKLRWLVGGYYESRDFNDFGSGLQASAAGAELFGFPAVGAESNQAQVSQTTYATFGQVDYKPVEPLTLTAGLRYESSKAYMDRRRIFEIEGGDTVPLGSTFNDVEQTDSELLPRFALEYRFNPNLMAYGSVSKGYKPGGLNYRTDSAESLNFEAERSWNYEIGLKSSWFDNRLTANLALFTNQVDNFQVAVFDDSLVSSTVVNAGVRINGIELELKATPIKGLDLIAGIGYADGDFTDYTNPLTGQNFDGNRLTYAPDYNYNLAVQYRSQGGIFARFELQGIGTYTNLK